MSQTLGLLLLAFVTWKNPLCGLGEKEGTVVKMKAQAHSNYVNISKLLNISMPCLSLK